MLNGGPGDACFGQQSSASDGTIIVLRMVLNREGWDSMVKSASGAHSASALAMASPALSPRVWAGRAEEQMYVFVT